jgi:hypothetical protein
VVAALVPVNDRSLALMLTAMRNALRRFVIALISVLAIFAAFAAGIGVYALAWWPLVLVGGAFAVVLGAWWLWWRLPKRQADRLRLTIRDPKARADVEDNYRKNVGQIFVGVAAALRDRELAQQAEESHATLMNTAFVKAFEQIASDKFLVRVAGIYALETVIDGSAQYRQPAVDALCAYVRDVSKTETGEGPPTTDIKAALEVLVRPASRQQLNL